MLLIYTTICCLFLGETMRLQDWVKKLGSGEDGRGGQTSLAHLMNVRPQTVSEWIRLQRSPNRRNRTVIRKLSNGRVDFESFDQEYDRAHEQESA